MKWVLGLSILATVFLAFVGGLVAALMGLPPAPSARVILAEVRETAGNWRAFLSDEPSYLLEPAVYEGDGVVVSRPEEMQPGVTLLTGLFGNRLGFRMVAADGTVIHDWPIDFFEIAPEQMRHQFHALIHGTQLYPNGDIVANLDGRSTVRLDACGNILWRNNEATHHSLHADDTGALWAPSLEGEVENPAFAGVPFQMDTLVSIDPDTGERIRRIPLIDVLDDSDRLSLARLGLQIARMDVVHTNDVEPLSAGMAGAFPMFSAGDLLISSRNLNQLWVVDGQSEELKWAYIGTTEGQHDPDFQPDGTITVLDNFGRSAGPDGPASRIVAIDPATGTAETLFRGSPETPFFTPYRGKHEVLGNGNILIAETDRGRAFEVTPEGEVVWSYINRWDEDQVGWVMQADRYPDSYAVDEVACD